jgi:hypothetical protein
MGIMSERRVYIQSEAEKKKKLKNNRVLGPAGQYQKV